MAAKISDANSIMAYSHWLVMKAQIVGNLRFDGHTATAEETLVAQQCHTLCDKISRQITFCDDNDIPYLLECYDIAFRVGNKRIPDIDFINSHKRRVVKAWEAGDRKIEESSVFGIVAHDVKYRHKQADKDYFRIYQTIKEKWLDTLRMYDCFSEVTTYENYQRLALIMLENLDKELGNKVNEAKRGWYEHNRVENISTLGSLILRSYRRFISSLFPSVLDFNEKIDLDDRILSELSTRTDLNPYDREAFRLSLEFNREFSTGN